ncbi:MAG: hypothetical protein ABF335_00925 [Alphaproteobacteria bacterium]
MKSAVSATVGALMMASYAVADFIIPPDDLVICKVNAYSVYQVARKQGYTFRCLSESGNGTAMFVTEKSMRRIGCEGQVRQTFGQPRVSHRVNTLLLGRANNLEPQMYNGWSLTSYSVDGGHYNAHLKSEKALIDYSFEMSGEDAKGRRLLEFVRIEKPGGDCDEALYQAFNPRPVNMAVNMAGKLAGL